MDSSPPTVDSSRMTELARHWQAFRESTKFSKQQWRSFRWLALVVVIAFVGGWISAGVSAFQAQARPEEAMAAMLRGMELRERAESRDEFWERMTVRQIDHAIRSENQYRQASVWQRAIWRLSAPMSAFYSVDAQVSAGLVRAGEARLKFAPKPSAENLADLKQLDMAVRLDFIADSYQATAAAYSAVLGRPITASQMVTRSGVQSAIDTGRVSLQQVSSK